MKTETAPYVTISVMTSGLDGLVGLVALVVLAALVVLTPLIGNRIARGRRPRRRASDLRAEDSVGYRRDTGGTVAADAIAGTQYDRQRGDFSGLGGM